PYAKAYGGEGTITLEPNGYLSYYYGTAGNNNTPYGAYSSRSPIPNNQWSHIAVVRDLSSTQKTVKIYINGTLNNVMSAQHATCVASTLNALIGAGYVDNFDGQLDNVRVWNVARTQAQILADMHLEIPTVTTGLVAHYTMNGNANAQVGPNGTASNMTWTNANYYTYTWS